MWWKHLANDLQQKTAETAGPVIFCAGFGPSGLPHIGTLSEALRANTVKTAFEKLSGRKAKLFIVSDDLDALRKIPDTCPEGKNLVSSLGLPLCDIPSPFGEAVSFSASINAKLHSALAPYGIDYQLISNSELYRSGHYNSTITRFLEHIAPINLVIAKRLGHDRRKSYSIFMPVSRFSGKLIEHIVIRDIDLARGEITYRIPSNLLVIRPGNDYSIRTQDYYKGEPIDEDISTSVLNGHCKLQWKADWAMRLIHLKVAFEMHGEDLTDSAHTARDICRLLDAPPPLLIKYGLFTDSAGRKISKSKGNGLSLDQIERYIPQAALQHYMLKSPFRHTCFHHQIAVTAYDNYCINHARYMDGNWPGALAFFDRLPKHGKRHATYRRIINIFTACHPETIEAAYFYLLKHNKSRHDILAGDGFGVVVEKAFAYYCDCIAATFQPKLLIPDAPTFLRRFCDGLKKLPADHVFDRAQFKALLDKHFMTKRSMAYRILYACLFGDEHGPRLIEYFNRRGLAAFCKKLDTNLAFAINRKKELPTDLTPPTNITLKPARARLHTVPAMNSSALPRIDFEEVKARASTFSEHINFHREAIAHSLSGFECYNVAIDEIERCIDFLQGIEINRPYFERRVQCVASYLPLNQPIYATTCFGIVPSFMATQAWVRPPTAMHAHYKKLLEILNLGGYFPNLRVSFAEKEEFVSMTAPISNAVIFTGTPGNAAKVRRSYPKSTLFILNGAGHNPLIVAQDASIDKAVTSAMRVVLYNQGQDCAGPNSILVHKSVYPRFITRLKERLLACEGLVGSYASKENIVGPNSDPDHTLKISKLFREYRQHCTYGGEINPVTGLIRPAIFERALTLGGNYKELFAPVFMVQRYDNDVDLADYFENPLYEPHSMYVSVFGHSNYVEGMIDSGKHAVETVLRNTDLHRVEKGYYPYGGYGAAASCLYVNGERIAKPTLPQRDIHEYLVAG